MIIANKDEIFLPLCFEDCIEAARVNLLSGECEFLIRFTDVSESADFISFGAYIRQLAQSGWLHRSDNELYKGQLDADFIRKNLSAGNKLVLNGVRVKPADVYVWTTFEFIAPCSLSEKSPWIYFFIREYGRRLSVEDKLMRDASAKYNVIIMANLTNRTFFPLRSSSLSGHDRLRAELYDCIEELRAAAAANSSEPRCILRREYGGIIAEIDTFSDGGSGLLALVTVRGKHITDDEHKSVREYYGFIDIDTGLRSHACYRKLCDRYLRSKYKDSVGVCVVEMDGRCGNFRALAWLLRDEFPDNAFKISDSCIAVIIRNESRTDFMRRVDKLCRRIDSIGCKASIRTAWQECPESVENVAGSCREFIRQ